MAVFWARSIPAFFDEGKDATCLLMDVVKDCSEYRAARTPLPCIEPNRWEMRELVTLLHYNEALLITVPEHIVSTRIAIFCRCRLFECHRSMGKPVLGSLSQLVYPVQLAQWYFQEAVEGSLEVRLECQSTA
jgi:hypothetical protein